MPDLGLTTTGCSTIFRAKKLKVSMRSPQVTAQDDYSERFVHGVDRIKGYAAISFAIKTMTPMVQS